MDFYKKKKFLLGILITALIIITIVGPYWYFHPTHYRYNDRFVIGKSASQIIEKYGEFDKVFYSNKDGEIQAAGYITEPSRPTWWDETWPKYYFISFKDGKAIRVKIEVGGWGG